jgi:hypothetical protein
VPDAKSASDGKGTTFYSNQLLDNIFSFAAQTHANILWDFNGAPSVWDHRRILK